MRYKRMLKYSPLCECYAVGNASRIQGILKHLSINQSALQREIKHDNNSKRLKTSHIMQILHSISCIYPSSTIYKGLDSSWLQFRRTLCGNW